MVERVLFVHAHPDDETISTGATIATLVAAGAQVTVLTCTRGERGEVIPADLQHLLASPETLGGHREAELAAALTALGVTDSRILGNPNARWKGREPRRYRDSGMQWRADGVATAIAAAGVDESDAHSLTAADAGEVAADIAAVMIDVEPDVVVSYAADGGYGHPDHIRAHEATRIAAEVIGIPFYVIDDGGAPQLAVVVEPVQAVKRAALAQYRTQLTVDGDAFSLSSGPARPITAPETFSRLRAYPIPFEDQGAGIRIATGVVALVLGAVVGATLTVSHQATVLLGTITVPWGIIVAVLITAALLAGLRLVFTTRLVPLCATIGVIGVSAFLSLFSPGGSVLVPAGPAGYIWTFAPVLIAGVVLGWPHVSSVQRRTIRSKSFPP